jgi:hypothetical protein
MIIISFIAFRSKVKDELIFAIYLSIRDVYKGPLEKNPQSISILWDLIMYHVSSFLGKLMNEIVLFGSLNVVVSKIKMILISH